MSYDRSPIAVGQIWLDKETGRLVKILRECVHDTGPAWTYVDARWKPEPGGWHYCDVFDFVLWGRFERVF